MVRKIGRLAICVCDSRAGAFIWSDLDVAAAKFAGSGKDREWTKVVCQKPDRKGGQPAQRGFDENERNRDEPSVTVGLVTRDAVAVIAF